MGCPVEGILPNADMYTCDMATNETLHAGAKPCTFAANLSRWCSTGSCNVALPHLLQN